MGIDVDWSKAPEWNGEGLPPVGCECEVYPYFEKCRICCEYDGGVIVHNLHDDGFFHAKNDGEYRFRPIRTKEQRQREEQAENLAECLAEAMDGIKFNYSFQDAKAIAYSVIDAGWRNQP